MAPAKQILVFHPSVAVDEGLPLPDFERLSLRDYRFGLQGDAKLSGSAGVGGDASDERDCGASGKINFDFPSPLNERNSAAFDKCYGWADIIEIAENPGHRVTDNWNFSNDYLQARSLFLNQKLNVLFGSFGSFIRSSGVNIRGLNRAPEIQNLKSAHKDKQSCGKNESFIVKVFFSLNLYLGGGNNTNGFAVICFCFAGTLICIFFGGVLVDSGWRTLGRVLMGLGILLDFIGVSLLWGWPVPQKDSNECQITETVHANTVTQQLLTTPYYCNTLIAIGRAHMANVLNKDKQITVVSLLAEGASIRSIERVTGVHRDTVMRLGVRVGKGCARLLDVKMQNLSCKQIQFDEIWGFICKKERHCTPEDSIELGDVWTFCAIDAETKIVPSFKVGKRDLGTANAFVSDVASRLRNRVQISSDALRAYVDAVEMNFGADVDFAQIIKTYITDDSHVPERRFSAPEIVVTEKKTVSGFPDLRKASTSHIERLNGTTRLHVRRLARLTYAFSKKLENFEAAVALHFAYYNFVKRHITLRATPAMAAGIERDFWTVGNLVEASV